LAQDFPIHVVTAWLGNTPTIAMRHYLLTTDADFERAAGGKTRTEKAVQIPVQQAPETGCNDEQPESANRDFPRENETLHPGATSKNGEGRIRTRFTMF
jgi:formylglycine-generating enzyme required for sulfatase activity